MIPVADPLIARVSYRDAPPGPPLATVTAGCPARRGQVTVKLWWLVAVPAGVVTVMRPVVAPAGTVVTI